MIEELAHGQSFGLSQLDVDLVNSETIEARVRWSRRITAYRDELKPALGLSPHAAVFPTGVASRPSTGSSSGPESGIADQTESWPQTAPLTAPAPPATPPIER